MTFVQKQLSLGMRAPVARVFSCGVDLRARAREV